MSRAGRTSSGNNRVGLSYGEGLSPPILVTDSGPVYESTTRRAHGKRAMPTRATANAVLLCLSVLLFSFSLQYFIVRSMQSTTPTNALIVNLGISATVFVVLLVISKQPQDRGNETQGGLDTTFLVPLTPWCQAMAVFLNFSLASHIVGSSWLELLIWLSLGKNDLSFVRLY